MFNFAELTIDYPVNLKPNFPHSEKYHSK